ncbi:MAG: DUF2442 domain-containing protein [Deltaproteobacteria bacterium]|jgi:hypothetical protein|nr:DUF2442 domain-containing protein [Deltaproteobacteria bacterium]
MNTFPKIQEVTPLPGKRLLVKFKNNIKKIYDCLPLLDDSNFKALLDDGLFRSVRADRHGYGVSWNDKLDLSESELWMNGAFLDQSKTV